MKRNVGTIAALFIASALLAPVRARGAVYELASEWPSVTFDDGGKPVSAFMHMPDLDTPNLDRSGGTIEPCIPLYEVSLIDASRRPDGQVMSVTLSSRQSPYRLMVRTDANRGTHAVKRDPDFRAEVSARPVSLLAAFGLQAPSVDGVLVVRKIAPPAAPVDSLNEIEAAAVNSLDPGDRAQWVGECGGGPGAPEALPCWRGKVKTLLARSKTELPEQGFSAFERRYMKERLSRKSYEQFERALADAGSGDKLALVRSWKDLVLKRDIEASAEADAKAGVAPVPAPIPTAPSAAAAPAAVAAPAPAPAAASPAAKSAASSAAATTIAQAPAAATPGLPSKRPLIAAVIAVMLLGSAAFFLFVR